MSEKKVFNREALAELQRRFELTHAKWNRESYVEGALHANLPKFDEICNKVAEEIGVEPKFVKHIFIAGVLHSSTSQYQSMQKPAYIGPYINRFGLEDGMRKANALLNSNNQSILNIVTSRNGTDYIRCDAVLDEDEVNTMDCFEFKWPMIIPPKPVTAYSDGYLVATDIPNSKGNPPNKEGAFYDLDRANKVAFEFDKHVLNDIDIQFKLSPKALAKARAKGEEEPDVGQAIRQWQTRMFRLNRIREEFEKYGITTFWLTHFNDGRLRIYCKGHQVNEQGMDQDKALLKFARKHKLTKRGLRWLKIGIVNAISPKINGVSGDKCLHEAKLQWFAEHESELEAIATARKADDTYPEEFRMQYTASEPIKAQALIYCYREWQKNPDMETGIIVGQDGVCSGLGIQSTCLHDKVMMGMVGVTGDKPTDIYSFLAKERNMERLVMKLCMVPLLYAGELDAKEILGEEEFYNLKEYLCQYPTFEHIFSLPNQWKDDWELLRWYLPDGARTQCYVKTSTPWSTVFLGEEIEGSIKGFGANPKRNKSLGPNITHSVDGFVCREMSSRCSYTPEQKELIVSYLDKGAKVTKEPLLGRKKDEELARLLKLADEFKYVSFHIIDLLDEHNIAFVPREMLEKFATELPEESFEITRIHDCFGAHPNYCDDVLQQYRYIMHDLYLSDMFKHISAELGIHMKIGMKQPEVARAILEAQYCLM